MCYKLICIFPVWRKPSTSFKWFFRLGSPSLKLYIKNPGGHCYWERGTTPQKYAPWKSNHHFFTGWFTNQPHVFQVTAYHHPVGTTNFQNDGCLPRVGIPYPLHSTTTLFHPENPQQSRRGLVFHYGVDNCLWKFTLEVPWSRYRVCIQKAIYIYKEYVHMLAVFISMEYVYIICSI